MSPSERCVSLVKSFEGFRSSPYLCPAGVPTIGYGHTRGVTLSSPVITESEADALLRADLQVFAGKVNALLAVPVQQCQFDALVSFAYNIGVGALGNSTLLRKLNAGDLQGASAEFDRWTHAGPKILPGLVIRRAAERALFDGGLR